MLLLKQSVSKTDLVEKQNDFLFVKSDKKTIKVKIADILYIEGLGDYIKLYLTDKKLVTNLSMKKLENLLPPDRFYRIHKSFIISLDKIESIEGNMVKISNTKLPIGNLYRQEFMMFVKNFLAE